MANIFEVVVVGAGMFGSAAAKHLSRAGADVLVIGHAEPDGDLPTDQNTFGAYFDGARITRRLGWDEVWGAMDARPLGRFGDIEAESGIKFLHECGSLVVLARSIEHRTNAILRHCEVEGIAVKRMSEDALSAEFTELGLPRLTGGAEGLLEYDRAGYINPRKLVQAQLTLVGAAGGQLLSAAVKAVRRDEQSGLWHLLASGAGGTTEVKAEKIVLATGAFTNHNNVLPCGYRLALHAFTEPNLLFEVGGNQLDRLRGLPAIVTVDPDDTGNANKSLYLLPPIHYPDGKWYMRIGPGMQPIVEGLRTVDEMNAWYAAQRVTAPQAAFLTEMMKMFVPGLTPASVREAACIIEKTPSRYPYIGHIDSDESLTVVVGGNGHGARGSDEIGRLASTVALGRPWDCPIPQATFAPLAASEQATHSGRPAFLKPPFGLC